MEYKLSKESARTVVQKLLDYIEVDLEDVEDENIKKVIEASMPRLIKSIRLGRLEIIDTDGFKIKYTLRSGKDTLEFGVPGAAAKRAMGSKATTDFYGKIYAMIASAMGVPESAIDKITDPVDLSVIEVLGAIFLSV